MIEFMIALAISLFLFGGIFMLCDDKGEYIQLFRTDYKLIALVFIPVIMFFGYPIFLYTLAIPADNLLWNIYNFTGMPTAALPRGSYYRWWDLTYVGVDTIKRIFFYFPIGGFALIGLVWYNWKRATTGSYILLLMIEFIVLIITFSYR